ncbi:MAG: hypothetical protein LUI02_07285, partial [Clostridiales bacterium]|nr:hypothetical protein [Clostridiales bacterium]
MEKAGNRKTQAVKGHLLAGIFAVAMALAVLIVHAQVAQAASLSIKASASSVKIGDSVTVTITVPGGISATVSLTYPSDILTYVSASETANANAGSVAMTIGGYGGTDTATSATVTFKASGAGKATFSVTAPIAGDQTGDQVSVDGASTSITVENAASDSGSSSSGSSDSGSSG